MDKKDFNHQLNQVKEAIDYLKNHQSLWTNYNDNLNTIERKTRLKTRLDDLSFSLYSLSSSIDQDVLD